WFWREESKIGVGGVYDSKVFMAAANLALESVWRESHSGVVHRPTGIKFAQFKKKQCSPILPVWL
ncbi:hypothetical protein PoB_000508600, partial [Plakobranchus ocellatus]